MRNAQHHRIIFLLILFFPVVFLPAQSTYRVGCIAFYNFENLFDTLDAPDIADEDFTPRGANRYTGAIYREKLDRLSQVTGELGAAFTPDGPALLGVAEIENRQVLEDFVAHPRLAERDYRIVHYDSPDPRGIDVALLYQPRYFEVSDSRPLPVILYNPDGSRRYTRDILLVSGRFDGEPLHVLVNHWPSRSGGEAATQPYRNAAARVCRQVSDSLFRSDPNARIVIMGDLNDDPVSPSVRDVIGAKRKISQVPARGFYNPMYDLFKQGIGTLAYRDAWSLFDQILVSEPLLRDEGGYRLYQTHVYNKPYLTQSSGQFKGYPFRTFAGNAYLGGYSDHFPVFIVLIKPVSAGAH